MEQGRMNLVPTALTASEPSYLHPLTPTMAIDGSHHCKMVRHPSVALPSMGNLFFPMFWRKYEEIHSLCWSLNSFTKLCVVTFLNLDQGYNPEDYKLSGTGGKRWQKWKATNLSLWEQIPNPAVSTAPPETFWTCCSQCTKQYEYHRRYLDVW